MRIETDRLREKERERETDRQTDVTKLTVTFRNFVNAPNDCTKGMSASTVNSVLPPLS